MKYWKKVREIFNFTTPSIFTIENNGHYILANNNFFKVAGIITFTFV